MERVSEIATIDAAIATATSTRAIARLLFRRELLENDACDTTTQHVTMQCSPTQHQPTAVPRGASTRLHSRADLHPRKAVSLLDLHPAVHQQGQRHEARADVQQTHTGEKPYPCSICTRLAGSCRPSLKIIIRHALAGRRVLYGPWCVCKHALGAFTFRRV